MADSHSSDSSSKSPGSTSWLNYFLFLSSVFIVIVATIFFVLFNEEQAKNLLYFIYSLEILFGIILVFLIYKLYMLTVDFQVESDKIGMWYVNKYKPNNNQDKTPSNTKTKIEYIRDYLDNNDPSLWKLAIVEVDKLMKEALLNKGFNGKNIDELFEEAKENGFKFSNEGKRLHSIKTKIAMSSLQDKIEKNEMIKIFEFYQKIIEEINKMEPK